MEEKLKMDKLTGSQKAAILMVALGPEASSLVFKHLSDAEMEKLTREIALLQDVPPKVRDKVMEEFHQMMVAHNYILPAGVDYARKVLEQAVGASRAGSILQRVQSSSLVADFSSLKEVDPAQLLGIIQKEHPQTIALILTQLGPDQAATILSELPEEMRVEVIYRIATIDQVSLETLREVKNTLESRIDRRVGRSKIGGAKVAADILNLVGQTIEKDILNELGEQDPGLATEIKNLMFTFEDIVLLDDISVQRVLREVRTEELSLALKGASEEVKEKIFSNMSERGVMIVKEEMEYMGPVRLRDVWKAQHKITDVVRALEERGEVVIGARERGEEEFIV